MPSLSVDDVDDAEVDAEHTGRLGQRGSVDVAHARDVPLIPFNHQLDLAVAEGIVAYKARLTGEPVLFVNPRSYRDRAKPARDVGSSIVATDQSKPPSLQSRASIQSSPISTLPGTSGRGRP
jgi:hypothetical protein